MQCRTAKPKNKPYKIFDSEGLYLEVHPSGRKYWRQKYHIYGKEKRISHGIYPDVALIEARQKRNEVKGYLQKGLDPILVRLEKQQTAALAQAETFEKVAREWFGKQVSHWTGRYAQSVKFRLEKYAFSEIGDYPVHMIKPPVMLSCLQKIEKKSPETTRRIKALCSHIFKYAIATGRAENDPTYGLEAALKKFRKGHYASITVDEFPTFLLRLHEYKDRISRQTFLATMALLLTMVRTAELIEAKRTEFDLQNKMWIIPPERMKMGLAHMVPLSNQMVKIIEELMGMCRNSEYLFPSYSNPRKPMSKNTILVAIKRMGYNGRMTGHGFRSLGLGLLKEKLGYSHEVADRQLAHVPQSSVDRAYDRAQFLPQRIEMMQRYSDYVDDVYVQEISKKYSSGRAT
jgi:integrase